MATEEPDTTSPHQTGRAPNPATNTLPGNEELLAAYEQLVVGRRVCGQPEGLPRLIDDFHAAAFSPEPS